MIFWSFWNQKSRGRQMHITVDQKMHWKNPFLHCFGCCHHFYKLIVLLQINFLQELCVVHFFFKRSKHIQWKKFESNSKNTYWKVLVNFWPFKKVFKWSLSLIITSLIRILISILIIQLVANYYQTYNLIIEDLWVHLQLFE
jgi:hypothetical protein